MARSLLFDWAVSELGMSLKELARRLEMDSPGVGFSVERGEGFLLRPRVARLPATVLNSRGDPASGLSHKQLIFMGPVRGLHLQ